MSTKGAIGVQQQRARARVGRRALAATFAAAGTLAAAAHGAAAKPAATGTTPSGSFTVKLAGGRSVQVDNLTSWSASQLTSFVQWADRGMATTDPLHQNATGEMETGDRVVVTPAGIYWLDLMRRGGLLSGIWPLTTTGSGAPAFQYVVNNDEWEPNSLLPGAAGNDQALYDAGQSLLVVPEGGEDGSCKPGQGTFVLGNSDNCGIADSGVKVTLTTGGSNGDHTYTVSGTLYQEGTAGATLMTDSSGHSATMSFTLTYHFRDASASDEYSNEGPADQRVRTDITLQPSAPIDLSTLVVSGDSDQGGASYPSRQWDYSDVTRYWAYPNQDLAEIAGGAPGQICEGACAGSNYITEFYNKLPTTLAAGDFATEAQTSAPSDATQRQLSYMLPPTLVYQLPERIDHIWNAGLDVSSFDVDYFNGESFAASGPMHLLFDAQTTPHLP